MITLRRSDERGHADIGWLDSRHTFSFGEYRDPRHMGYRALRVINEDRVAPSMGFGAHGHRDMEIVTYVLNGALAHRDSMGNHRVLGAGEVQRITAGSGIVHSEFNASDAEPVHFLQIWIEPAERNTTPSYEEKAIDRANAINGWTTIAAPNGAGGGMHLGQDASIHITTPTPGQTLKHTLNPNRAAWLHVVRGTVTVNGTALTTGDAAAIENEPEITITGIFAEAEILLFDLA